MEDRSPHKFLQIYIAAIQATGGGEHVMANNLPTVLKGSTHLWLLNEPPESIYSWQHLCDLLLANFQGTYNHPSKEDDLHRMRQESHETLRQYIRCFSQV